MRKTYVLGSLILYFLNTMLTQEFPYVDVKSKESGKFSVCEDDHTNTRVEYKENLLSLSMLE